MIRNGLYAFIAVLSMMCVVITTLIAIYADSGAGIA
jgi:hypothetical protein